MKYAAMILVALLATSPSCAQDDEPEFPHGDYEEDCSMCHGDEGFSPAVISPEFTHTDKVPLQGTHAEMDCDMCHESLRFSEMEGDCLTCHSDRHQGIPASDCAGCHRFEGWSPARIDPEFTHTDRFPLQGVHARAECVLCHESLHFQEASRDCTSCHSDVHQGKMGVDCLRCHGEGWREARIAPDFAHTGRFPLRGVHARLECVACHESVRFDDAVRECVSCHSDVHRGEMGADCSRCHTERNFIDRSAMINAHQSTRFPLRGSHRSLDCEDCHSLTPEGRMQYVNREADCEACHMDDYNGAVSPDHTALGFPTDCEQCHNSIAWDLTPGSFDHDLFAGLACVTCHLNDYNETSDPDHAAFDFPQDCTECHDSTTTWEGARFDHNLVPGVPCESCHLDDYNQTTDPNHSAASFPTDCMTCHSSTTTWEGAEFDHDGSYFPIYVGIHRNRWDDCSDCHVNPSSYNEFRCVDCHAHDDEQIMAEEHSSVPGYTYASSACYACHPDGRVPR